MMKRFSILLSAAATLAMLFGVAPARAEGGPLSGILKAELLPGWRTQTGSHMAALRLTLGQGWKTYWRAPGDAGIPPDFHWQGSDNIGAVRIHWPKPSVFDFNGLKTIGYAREVVLPIEIWPQRAGAPITVAAQVDLGVCRDICVPASLALGAELTPATVGTDPAIRSALGARPKTAAEAGLRAHGCRIDPLPDGLQVTAELDLPQLGPEETVVIETADRGVWVSEAETRRQGGRLVATSALVNGSRAPFALDRSGITITVLAAGRAVQIDGCPAR